MMSGARGYNPHVPTAVSGHIQFGYTDRIDVAKFNFDFDGQYMYVQTSVPHETAGIGSSEKMVHQGVSGRTSNRSC